MDWILIIVLLTGPSGAAVAQVPGFRGQELCLDAARTVERQTEHDTLGDDVYAFCVRTGRS